MFDFDIAKWIPRFIQNDKNGNALAKAIEAGVQAMNDIIAEGVNRISDSEYMPEWRLDELAWEYNIPYDYAADVETKRLWVSNALVLSRLYGTPEGIVEYMSGYFDETTLEEAWQYDGDPFHFRVLFSGSWTPEKVAWATRAINTVKNVRSVLDSYTFIGKWLHDLYVGCALFTYEAATYQVPVVVIENDWYIDELENMLLDENGILLIVE